MPRFHFHLRAEDTIHRDLDGTDCADVSAARAHALAVAEELMHHSDRRTRHWSMRVENEDGKPAFDVFFADVDASLEGQPAHMRMLTAKTCRRYGALIDTLCALRATLTETRILIARAQRKPFLVYAKGR